MTDICDIHKKIPKNIPCGDNAFSIIADFTNQAKANSWTKEEIDCVIKEATSDDYNHLIQTFSDFVEVA